ncbi:MAG: hypothetical protein ACRDK3_02690 [Actinomycetota bacterium]
MRTRWLLTILLLAGGVVFAVPGPALACSCAPPPPLEAAVEDADAAFVGVVTSSERTDRPSGGPVVAAGGNFLYTFAVDEVLGGGVESAIEVNSHSEGASCGIKFREGGRYIVFAYESRRGLQTHLCTRTETVGASVSFGGRPPAGEVEPSGAQNDPGGEAGPPGLLVGAAAILALVALVALAKWLLPARR